MKQTIRDIQDWNGKRVLVRVDFNVPLDGQRNITDDTRIRESLPTIRFLTERQAKVILVSHMGRPKGQRNPEFSMIPIGNHLRDLLPDATIHMVHSVIGQEVTDRIAQMAPGDILLLENVRFEAGEEKNEPVLAQALANLCDIYVNDAFGAAHRAHASTEGIAHYASVKVAGLLMEKEIKALSMISENPARPCTAIIGGSKVSTKITVLNRLLDKVDTIVIGGGMLFTFLKAQGKSVGTSLVEEELLDTAKNLMQQAEQKGVRIVLASDVVIADAFKADANSNIVSVDNIPANWMGLDIGPESIQTIQQVIRESKTVFWNGPMGVFEFQAFSTGTRAVAETLAEATAQGCQSVLGGGDTVAALEVFGIAPVRYTHVSTGGGASLEFMEGRELPGIAALEDAATAAVI